MPILELIGANALVKAAFPYDLIKLLLLKR